MIGRKQWSVVSGRRPIITADRIRSAIPKSPYGILVRRTSIGDQKGFSLFELMIAMFILIILLSVAVPVYQRTVQHAKETVLKENLWQMRRAIEQYTADKGKLPASLEDLVEAKYLREMPIDPIIERAEWDPKFGADPTSPDGDQGVVDVKSTATGTDSEGNAYNGDSY